MHDNPWSRYALSAVSIGVERLAERWLRLCTLVSARSDRCGEIYGHLDSCYTEPHRHYHTWGHVAYCLELLDEYREAAERPECLELAVFYHDAVYVPGSGRNETDSAELLSRHAELLEIRLPARRLAPELVAYTRYDSESRKGKAGLHRDADLIRDIDLSILGAEPERYRAYQESIRREYAHIRDDIYRARRARILAWFLGNRTIYHTEEFTDRFEKQARENLRAALRDLTDDAVS